MSHAPTTLHGPGPYTPTSHARPALGIKWAPGALFAGLLAAAIFSMIPATDEGRDAPAPPAPPVAAAASTGTGVPQASAVFADKDVPVEDHAPSF